MEKDASNKMCPILTAAHIIYTPNDPVLGAGDYSIGFCRTTDCALWNEDADRCGLIFKKEWR